MSAMSATLSASEDSTVSRAFSFEWFSGLPGYRAANRAQIEAFLSDLRLPSPWTGIDVACGVGLMSELCHEVADRIGALIQRTVCIDLDRQALDIAREKLARYPANFLQSVGQRLPIHDNAASFLVLGNGIHMFSPEQKAGLFADAFRVLRGGASMFFNSAFYVGTEVEGTERFYTDKIRGAIRNIRRMLPRPEEAEGEKPEARYHLTADEYEQLARTAGFTEVERHEVPVNMDQELWEAICDYGEYAQGALHYKYPAEVACNALRQSVRDIFSDPDWDAKYPGMVENGQRVIPRRWLWVTARKPARA